jgi:hypothetical protein
VATVRIGKSAEYVPLCVRRSEAGNGGYLYAGASPLHGTGRGVRYILTVAGQPTVR